MADWSREGVAELRDQGYVDNIEVFRSLEMRYLGQNYELELPLSFDLFDDDGRRRNSGNSSTPRTILRFGFNNPGEIIEIVNFSCHRRLDHAEAGVSASCRGNRRRDTDSASIGDVSQGARCDMPVFRRDALRAGHHIAGPAVIEEAASVTILNPGQSLTVDPLRQSAAGDATLNPTLRRPAHGAWHEISSNGYYIEKYIKCANCGMLIYGDGIEGTHGDKPAYSARSGASSGQR